MGYVGSKVIIMGYRVRPDGTIDTDTADEAIEIAMKLAARSNVMRPVRVPVAPSESAPNETIRSESARSTENTKPLVSLDERTASLIASLAPRMLKVLALVQEHPEGITTDKLATGIDATSAVSLSGTLSGISKNIEKCGLKYADVLDKHSVGYGPERVITYRPGPALQKARIPV